jgi:hypothetical protein
MRECAAFGAEPLPSALYLELPLELPVFLNSLFEIIIQLLVYYSNPNYDKFR